MAARKHAELIKQWADDDSLEIEVRLYDDEDWEVVDCPSWKDECEYRIKPTKPSIDWSHVADEYKWLSTSLSGISNLFQKKPTSDYSDGTWGEDYFGTRAESHKSFKAGTCDWKDSLVQRQEGE